jgi:hypothetical protein
LDSFFALYQQQFCTTGRQLAQAPWRHDVQHLHDSHMGENEAMGPLAARDLSPGIMVILVPITRAGFRLH